MRKTVRLTIILLVVALGIAYLWIRSQKTQAREALAAYKADLRAKGEKLTWEELGYPKLPDTNASLNLLNGALTALGSSQFAPGSLEFMSYTNGRAQLAAELREPPLRFSSNKTNVPSWNDLANLFEDYSDAVTQLRQSTEDPPHTWISNPPDFLNSPPSPFVALRNAAQWLAADNIVALHQKNLLRALLDLRALRKLSQYYADDLTLVSQMIRIAVAGLALDSTWHALQAEGWTEETLKQLQTEWEKENYLDVYERGMAGERIGGLWAFKQLHEGDSALRMKYLSFGSSAKGLNFEAITMRYLALPMWAANAEDDERTYLEHMQQCLESGRRLTNGIPWPVVEKELRNEIAALEKRLSATGLGKVRYLFSSRAIPNHSRAALTVVQRETQRRLTVTAIALKRFHLRHGNYPQDIPTLVPEYLSAPLIDPMGAGAFGYRTNSDGSFTLYSMGANGFDDGGDSSPPKGTNRFGIWDGKDALWPQPVK